MKKLNEIAELITIVMIIVAMLIGFGYANYRLKANIVKEAIIESKTNNK